MKLSEIERRLADGELASELSLEDYTNKLKIIKENKIENWQQISHILRHIDYGDSCAICEVYGNQIDSCSECPLYEVSGLGCIDDPGSLYAKILGSKSYDDLVENTKKMIEALEKAVEYEKKI